VAYSIDVRTPHRLSGSHRLSQVFVAVLGAIATLGCGADAAVTVEPSKAAKVPIARVALPLAKGATGVAYAVATWRTGVVAVGESNERAAVWSSPDSQSWSALPSASVTHDAGAGREVMTSLAASPAVLVAGGFLVRGERPVAAVWSSTSPTGTWGLQSLAGRRPSEVHSTAVTAASTVAAGEQGPYDDADAAVWITQESGNWRAVTDASLGGSGRQTISGLASSAHGFVAVGSDRGLPAIWESSNATNWHRVAIQAQDRQPGELAAVMVRGDVAVAIGNSEDGATVWRSTRPSRWVRVSLPRPVSVDRHLNAITSTREFLAGGFVNHPQGDPNASILTSRSGTSWLSVAPDPALGGAQTQTIYGAATGAAYVAFAGADYADGPRPVIWLLGMR
jgi:hypothetical protein